MVVSEAGAPVVVSLDATVTVAPRAVVPVTVVEDTARVLPGDGAVIVTGSVPGAPWARYRSTVTRGVSTLCPTPSESDQPQLLRLRPGQRRRRPGRLAVGEPDGRSRRVAAER